MKILTTRVIQMQSLDYFSDVFWSGKTEWKIIAHNPQHASEKFKEYFFFLENSLQEDDRFMMCSFWVLKAAVKCLILIGQLHYFNIC